MFLSFDTKSIPTVSWISCINHLLGANINILKWFGDATYCLVYSNHGRHKNARLPIPKSTKFDPKTWLDFSVLMYWLPVITLFHYVRVIWRSLLMKRDYDFDSKIIIRSEKNYCSCQLVALERWVHPLMVIYSTKRTNYGYKMNIKLHLQSIYGWSENSTLKLDTSTWNI